MKKIIAMLLALTMVLALAACGGDPKETNGNDPVQQTTPVENQGNDPVETEPQAQNPSKAELTVEYLKSLPETATSEFTYTNSLDYDGILIQSYNGSSDVVVIPEQIDGVDVVDIAEYCFANDCTVRGLVIPGTVVEIAELCVNNESLELVVAEGVEKIGYMSFGNCSALREVVLDDSLTYFGEFAFASCTSLEKLYISSAVENLTEEEYAYGLAYCSNLTIYGEAGSFIEGVANELGIPFVAE